MPKDNARRILADPNPAIAEIEYAIAWLEDDIAYVERSHPFLSEELWKSLEESRSLVNQLREKLFNIQSK